MNEKTNNRRNRSGAGVSVYGGGGNRLDSSCRIGLQPETEKWLRALRISQKWLYGRTLAQMAGEEDETYRLALQNNYAATRRITLRAIMEMTPMGEPVYDNPEDEDFDGSYPYDD